MSNPGKPDAYEQGIGHLREQPIIKWACDLAGVSRQCVYEKMERDAGFRVRLRAAKAEGQRQRLKGVSDERASLLGVLKTPAKPHRVVTLRSLA